MNIKPSDLVVANETRSSGELDGVMSTMGRRARAAAGVLATASTDAKDAALRAAAAEIRREEAGILAANVADIRAMEASASSPASLDRAKLNPARVAAVADSLDAIAD